MIRIFYHNNTWFNVDNDHDADELLNAGAVEYTSDQIRNAAGNEFQICNEYMHLDGDNNWYFEIPSTVVTPEQRIKEIQDAVQNLLDSKAKEKMYDSALSIATYAISSDEIFKAEADAFVVWRDRCWRKCYDILAQFQSGEIEMPSVENVIEQLPTFDWDSLEISQ